MPVPKARAGLRWRGAETVRELTERLSRRETAVVFLPPGLHHALSVRVGAGDAAHGPIDVTVNAEKFERLTRIKGLRELEAVREPLEREGMTVRLRTPPPQLLFVARAKTPRSNAAHHWNRTVALA
jgi:hypothetical protein